MPKEQLEDSQTVDKLIGKAADEIGQQEWSGLGDTEVTAEDSKIVQILIDKTVKQPIP